MTKKHEAVPRITNLTERRQQLAQRRLALDSADLPTLLSYLEQTCWRRYLDGDLR